MDGTVDWWAAKFGILLGFRVLLIYRSIRAAIDKSLQNYAYQFGMWMQNGNVELAAILILGITLIGFF